EDHPSIKKSGEIAVRFPHIDVLPAGVWEHGAHLGEGETRQQRDHDPNHPHAQKQPRSARVQRDVLRGEKDSRTDDPTGQKQDGIKKGEPANEFVGWRQAVVWGKQWTRYNRDFTERVKLESKHSRGRVCHTILLAAGGCFHLPLFRLLSVVLRRLAF